MRTEHYLFHVLGVTSESVFHPILFILAGNDDMHESSEGFEIRHNPITLCGVSCPLAQEKSPFCNGERGGLVDNASDSGSRGRGFELHSGQTVLCLEQGTFIAQKYW